MEVDKLIRILHSLERTVLPALKENKDLNSIIKATKLKEIEVVRALQWLENKKIIKIKKELKEIISLDNNGKKYLKEGLPEKRFLKALERPLTLNEIKEKAKLDKDELDLCLGLLKKKAAITFKEGKVEKLPQGKRLEEKETLEESFLKSLPLDFSKLSNEQKYAFQELKKRKEIIKTDIVKDILVELTHLGKELIKHKLEKNLIDSLNSRILKSKGWKGKQFRGYDIKINVPKIYAGKRHFVNQAIEYARRIWLDLGFKEMTGPIINTSFWNFDALFTAQDHPVRELQDTFFIKEPEKGRLPDKILVNNVKKTHENGWKTKSIGWRYKWNEEEAKKNVLRTHTTVLSAKTLAEIKKDGIPAKYFAIGKCFRNETVDWAHLFEFNQTEGIVIDPNANFRHLLGYLKEFFRKMGYPKARFRPAYFPYTELSLEIDIYHPIHKKWIELGGAGIFRPEVVVPLLGEDIPVLAWGPGFDRIIMNYYKINDMRMLYKNDLKQLREIKSWLM